MNDDKVSYYAIIPAPVRYDKRLKAAEKILYGELTALANKYGYCYAKNKYFADLYYVTNRTISEWISHLNELGYIDIELIRDARKEIKERRIYIRDTPYRKKILYPYGKNLLYPMEENFLENNTRINKNDLFYFFIYGSEKIEQGLYSIYKRLEFNYSKEMVDTMTDENIEIIKNIIFVIYEIYYSEFKFILDKVKRETIINLYRTVLEYDCNDFISYYKKAIINEYAKR